MTRQYESLVRAARASNTRRRVADAARELFLTQGWANTTIREVARRAGVSPPTVYAAYGNKKGLALALMDGADLLADPEAALRDAQQADGDAYRQLRASIAYDCRLFDRAGDMLILMREAGRNDPDLMGAYLEGSRRGDAARRDLFLSWNDSALAQGVTLQRAIDIYAAICTVDAFIDLRDRRDWSPDSIEQCWNQIVSGALLRAPT